MPLSEGFGESDVDGTRGDVRTVPRVAGAQTRGDLGLGDPLFYLQRSNVEDLLRISILSGFYIYAAPFIVHGAGDLSRARNPNLAVFFLYLVYHARDVGLSRVPRRLRLLITFPRCDEGDALGLLEGVASGADRHGGFSGCGEYSWRRA